MADYNSAYTGATIDNAVKQLTNPDSVSITSNFAFDSFASKSYRIGKTVFINIHASVWQGGFQSGQSLATISNYAGTNASRVLSMTVLLNDEYSAPYPCSINTGGVITAQRAVAAGDIWISGFYTEQ